jgi:hypothetical protein
VEVTIVRRPEEQNVGLVAQILTGRPQIDLPAVRLRLEAPVEALEGLAGRQSRQLQHGRDAALVFALELTGEQQIEIGERTEVIASGLLDELGQHRRGMIEAERGCRAISWPSAHTATCCAVPRTSTVRPTQTNGTE